MMERVSSYMTEQEAAEYLKVSTKTLQRWRYQCSPPVYHKFGKNVRYRLSDLDEYANSQRIKPIG
jgi:excisionase family DNA binding protein